MNIDLLKIEIKKQQQMTQKIIILNQNNANMSNDNPITYPGAGSTKKGFV